MRHLVDTNVWLQPILKQIDAVECAEYLQALRHDVLAVTDFSWHSIGVVCVKRKLFDAFDQFVTSVLAAEQVRIISLDPSEMPQVTAAGRRYGLDFDDAYQYVASLKVGLRVVSCDKDFAKTPEGYLRPRDAMPPQNGQQP